MSLDSHIRRLAANLQQRAEASDASSAATVRQEAQRGIDGREPALGTPAADGYVLSSSMAGVRLWVPRDALSNATPQPLGTATAGVATEVSRADHVHALPTDFPLINVGTTGAAAGQVKASGDLFALNDPSGLSSRLVNIYNVPTDHFTSFSGWTWAGAPFAGAPSNVLTTVFPSVIFVYHNALGVDHFAHQAGADARIRVAVGTDSYVGARVDDGTANNAVEIRVQATSAGKNDIQVLTTVGGVTTTTTPYTGLVPQWWLIRAVRTGTAVQAFLSINIPFLAVAGSASASWTAVRAGFTFGQRGVANSTIRAAMYDWAVIV